MRRIREPANVDEKAGERRRHERYVLLPAVSATVSMTAEGRPVSDRGALANVSAGGIACMLPLDASGAWRADQTAEVAFRLGLERHAVRISGRIVSCVRNWRTRKAKVAMAFDAAPGTREAQGVIRAFFGDADVC